MIGRFRFGCAAFLLATLATLADAQQPPSIGYMFPSGGQAGSTVDVVLGGYDWTPDVEVFVRDDRIALELAGKPGPVIVPEPPYWFGKKARRAPFMLPRETPARLTLPAGLPAGIYRWQVANANGVSASGKFAVSNNRELVEIRDRTEPQSLGALPVTVSGQILSIEEVDEFEFIPSKSGAVTCQLVASSIGSPLTAVIEIRDASGQLVTDAADTAARDVSFSFEATANQRYVVRVFDSDFRGNRSFVYRLSLSEGAPAPLTIPEVNVPSDTIAAKPNASLPVPGAYTGPIPSRYGSVTFQLTASKGDTFDIEALAEAIGSPLDVVVTVTDENGKELKRVDDLPGTTDARFEFKAPADDTYNVAVSDASGAGGDDHSIFRLIVREAQPGFRLTTPEMHAVPIAGSSVLRIKAVRTGGFTDPIPISIDGLPEGVSIPDDAAIPAKRNDLKLKLTCAEDAGTTAAFVTVTAKTSIDEGEETVQSEPLLLAVTMVPPYLIDAEGKDDVTKWPRGATFPAPVLIERNESFTGNIVLEMAAKQGRHRQGIRGPEFIVRPEDTRVLYPVTLPEWLETTRTSRMVVNGVAQVADPKGRVRYSSLRLKTRIGFLPTGAMLKIECPLPELEVTSGSNFAFPINVFRSSGLEGPIQLELVDSPGFAADSVRLDEAAKQAALQVALQGESTNSQILSQTTTLKARATAKWKGHPVVAETTLLVAPVKPVQRPVAATPD